MHALRKNWLALLCLGTAFAFFGQTTLCLASEAGLITCAADADHQDCGTEGTETDHCWHCASPPTLFQASALAILDARTGAEAFARTNDSAPEGPVREIEYPPQLS